MYRWAVLKALAIDFSRLKITFLATFAGAVLMRSASVIMTFFMARRTGSAKHSM